APPPRRVAARARELRGEVEEESVVRPPAAGRQGVDLGDPLPRHAAAVALVGERRVGEAVAEDVDAAGEGRLDDRGEVLARAGEDEEELDDAVHRPPAGVEEDPPDGVAEWRAARLVGGEAGQAAPGEPRRRAPEMGGLAAPVEALEGDEEAGHREAK